MKLRIMTDSASDYTQEEAKKLGIDVIPLSIQIDGKSYLDGLEMSTKEFWRLVVEEKKMPKTSQPSQQAFIDIFEDAKKKGEEVLYIALSSALSGSYNGALLAASQVDYDKIHIVDSTTLVGGLQILVDLALRMDKEGHSVEEIIDEINKVKGRIQILGTMDTLDFVFRGGRGGKIASLVGNLLSIKPTILHTPDKGFRVIGKPFGRVRARINLLKEYKLRPADLNYQFNYYYAHDKSNLDQFIEKLKLENLYYPGKVIELGPTIGVHIGPDCYALVYVMKE